MPRFFQKKAERLVIGGKESYRCGSERPSRRVRPEPFEGVISFKVKK